MSKGESAATRALDRLGVAYRLFVHDRPLRSLTQAAAERDLAPEQVVRSLLFRLETGEFVLALIPGPDQVEWPKLRRQLEVSRVTTASADEVRRITGYAPGEVSPFGLAQPVRILADRRILEHEVISLGAGIPNAGLILRRADALRAIQPQLVDLR